MVLAPATAVTIPGHTLCLPDALSLLSGTVHNEGTGDNGVHIGTGLCPSCCSSNPPSLLTYLGKAAEDGPNVWVPVTHGGETQRKPWLWSGRALITADVWSSEPWMEDCSLYSLCLLTPTFKNKSGKFLRREQVCLFT